MYLLSNPMVGVEYHVSRRGVENLANAIIVQAANDYLESKKSIYQFGDTFDTLNKLTDTTIFFKSEWFGILTEVDGIRLMHMLDKEFEDWRKEYEAKRRKRWTT